MSLIYTPSAEAFDMAAERLTDERLQGRAEEYLGGSWPPGFNEVAGPKGVYASYMARGSEEEVRFLDIAKQAGFDPVVATYHGAEYVSNNTGLVGCYQPPLRLPDRQSRQWIVDTPDRPGPVGDAQTVYPKVDIQSYWDGVRNAVLPENGQEVPETVDFSEWHAEQAKRFGWDGGRSKSSEYYYALMALYASGRAVLFDTPPTEFADRVMKPPAVTAREVLGQEPLIVCEFPKTKRDWVNVAGLGEQACQQLLETGRIE